MTETLGIVLETEEPCDLDRVEAALAGCEDLPPELEPALTALVWRRCTRGHRGLIETFVSRECLERLDRLPWDLDRVGALRAASAVRELREACPLDRRHLGPGVIDWLDMNPDYHQRARELQDDLADIGPDIWSYLKRRRAACAEIALSPERRGILARLFG